MKSQDLKTLLQGLEDVISGGELEKKLKKGRKLIIKAGFDPSRPDLHLGHQVLINKLRQFQDLGHKVVFIVGDFTACIGDPSGQNKTRPSLTIKESRKNARSYKKQATKKNFPLSNLTEKEEQIFSFFKRLDSKKTKIVYNSKWLDKLSVREFI